MDIIPAFEAVVPGSNPGGGTRATQKAFGFNQMLFALESQLLGFRALVPTGAIPK